MSVSLARRATLRWLGPLPLATCLIPGWLAAQQSPDSTKAPAPRAAPLSEIVVTATRTTRRLDEVPANITVLTRRDFGTSTAQTVPALLSRVPGFAARDYQNPLATSPARSAPSFRGLGNSSAGRTLVLYDGVPLNEPFGGAVHWARLPLALVDRVEMVRGGGSMVWGSRSLGGVINILTRQPGPTRLDLELEGGDRSTLRGAGNLTARQGPVSVTIAGSAGESDGFRSVRPDLAGPIDVPIRTSHQMALGKVGVDLSSSVHGYLAGNYLHEWHQGPTPIDSGPATVGEVRGGVRVVTRRTGVLTFAGYANHRADLVISSNVAADRAGETLRAHLRSPSDGIGMSAQWSQSAGAHELSAGTDWSRVKGEGRETFGFSQGVFTRQRISSGRQLLAGVFLQDGWEPAPRWRLLGAIRLDQVRNSDGRRRELNLTSGALLLDTAYAAEASTRVSFNAGVRHEATRWLAWRASVYQGFRAVNLSEMYRPNRGTGRGNITESNPLLRPEHLLGAELGADLTLGDGLLMRVGGFWNRVEDAVVDFTVGVATRDGEVIDPCGAILKDQVCRQRRNVASLRTIGLETEIEYHPAPEWSLWGGYSFNPTRMSAPAQPIDGKRARGSARHVVTGLVAWEQPRLLGVSLEGRYVGTRYDDDLNSLVLGDFAVLGLRVNRRLNTQLSAYLKIENLFNTQFEVTRATTGIVEIGGPRWVLAGIRAAW
jgi:outer membrane receptor protein involved in Fe transport